MKNEELVDAIEKNDDKLVDNSAPGINISVNRKRQIKPILPFIAVLTLYDISRLDLRSISLALD